MNDNIFLDSNIIVYCYSTSDTRKQLIARTLMENEKACISTQVINETTNVLSKKYHIHWEDLERLITDFENNFTIQNLSTAEIKLACTMAQKYTLSFFDSLIIASALTLKCNILYSEDMHHNLVIYDTLTIRNPFL